MSQPHSGDDTRLTADDLLVIDSQPGEVSLSGEIDLSNVALLEKGLASSVVVGRPLVVEMSGVTFLDSTGLRCIVKFCEGGHRVIVRDPSSQVTQLLHLTALDGVLQVERTTTSTRVVPGLRERDAARESRPPRASSSGHEHGSAPGRAPASEVT